MKTIFLLISFFSILNEVYCFSFWNKIYDNGIETPIYNEPLFLSQNNVYLVNNTQFTIDDIDWASSELSPAVSVENAPCFLHATPKTYEEISITTQGVYVYNYYDEDFWERFKLPPPDNRDLRAIVIDGSAGNYQIRINPDSDVYCTVSDLMHEYGHIAGLGHSENSDAIMYDSYNSAYILHPDDAYGLYSHYCKPSIVKQTDLQKFLKGTNRNIPIIFNSIEKEYPQSYTVDLWDDTPIDVSALQLRQELLSEEPLTNQAQTNSIIEEWDSSELTAGLHKLSVYLTGSQDCSGDFPYLNGLPGRDIPMDELEVMLYDLIFRSPEYNKEYSLYAPLEFKVFGKSNTEEISISEITNIGSVEYLLEKKGTFWNTEIFTEVTDASTNFEFTKELSEITGLETGDYLVSVTAKDQQGATIAEIEDMPIRINTRSIQIQDPTSDEFMIYDFDLPSWYYTTYFVMAGRFYHEGLSNNDFRIPFPAELYDVKWCTENGVQVSVYSEDYPSELRVPDSTYAWTTGKWPGASKSSSSYVSKNADLYAESLNLQDSTHQGSLPMKDEQGVSWITDSSLNLRPGLYTFLGNMYDKKDYQNGIYTKLAETDTLQFLIPGWKMKTRIDPRYGDDRVHFRKTEDIEVCIWRPVAGLQANDTQVYLYDENKVTLLDSRTVTYSAGIGTSQAISFSTNNLDYGFYNLVAVETDYDTGIEVKFEKEIQVCPFYVNWESGGSWPSDWPGTTDGYWRIDSFVNNDPLVKYNSLENYYNYTTETEVLMNETKYSPSVELNKPYDAFMQIYIGLKRVNNYFKTLQAVYQVAISVDNQVTWDILKTANAEEWATYDWPDIYDRWCFANTETTIKNTNEPIYIRLTGIDPHGTLRDTTFTEGAGYDEIMIAYTKEKILEGPENIAAQFYTASKYDAVQLTWDNSPDYEAGRYYRVYRDGRLIGNMISGNSFFDYTTEPDKMYNYIVTLYDQTLASCGAVYESPKAGNSVDFYTGLLSPSGLSITDESPNIKLTWSPVSGASGYKVYSSDDPYGTFTENTTGTFDGEEWVAPLTESKLFYYVIAVNENKKVIKILRNSGNQVR
jgi:hypothetical protein